MDTYIHTFVHTYRGEEEKNDGTNGGIITTDRHSLLAIPMAEEVGSGGGRGESGPALV